MERFQQYRGGIARVVVEKIKSGKGKLLGSSVLLAPITAEMQTGGVILEVNTGRGDHELHEVVAVSDDVEDIEPGQHVIHFDAGAVLVPNGESAAYAIVDAKYILTAWEP